MKYFYILVLALLIIISGCRGGSKEPLRYTAFDGVIDNAKPIAFGEDDDIYIFCGLENRSALEPVLTLSLQREIQLVYPERYFNLIFGDIKDLDKLNNYKNLLFLGSLEAKDPVSRKLREQVSTQLQDKVRESGAEILVNKNHLSRDQLVLHVLAPTDARLKLLVESQANKIFELFLDRYRQRLAYQAYQAKVIPDSFFKPYPFNLKIPENFVLYSNDKDNRFLSFLYRAKMENREIPDKFLSIYYEDMDADGFNAKWLLDQRKRIGQVHFDGDSLNVETLKAELYKFGEYEGVRLSGSWINPSRIAGGAFQSYAFYDPKSHKAWIVDTMVYFPAGNKLPSLTELYMIGTSLKIK